MCRANPHRAVAARWRGPLALGDGRPVSRRWCAHPRRGLRSTGCRQAVLVSRSTRRARARRRLLHAARGAAPRCHKLSREQVGEAQRERLLVAVTELLAAHGYRGFGVGDIARRAGVSLGTFYDCFESKDAWCSPATTASSRCCSRDGRVDVPDDDRPALTAGLIGAYLDTLQQDLVVARAYQVEIDALGPVARARRRHALNPVRDVHP